MLGQLPALFISDVPGRRADHARDGVLFHVFGHVDPNHRLLVVEEKLGQRSRQLGLAHTGRPQVDERADGTPGVAQTRAVAANGVRYMRQGFFLADDALSQPVLHMNQLLHLALEHARDGNAGPLPHDLGNVLFVDFPA